MPWLAPAVPVLAGAGGGAALGGTAAGGTLAVSGSTVAAGAALAGTALLLSGDTPQNSQSSAVAGAAIPGLTPQEYADRLERAKQLADTLAKAAAASCATGNCCQRTIVISRSAAPQSAQHIDDAQQAGFPSTLTYDKNPSAARARRYKSTAGVPRIPNYEPDEYPPAAFIENGGSASVRNIDWRDNRIAGGVIGANLRGVPPGCRITIVTGP